MRIYLIQRGIFRNEPTNRHATGIDVILKFEYMGSSEYEWEALPKSLKRIRDNKMISSRIIIRDQEFMLTIPQHLTKYEIEEIKATILTLADKDKFYIVRLKEGAGIHRFFEPEMIEQIKKGCKKKTEMVRNYSWVETNFWWDIDNDWFLYPIQYHDQILQALSYKKKVSVFRKVKKFLFGGK